ncbi:MAG: 4Fe-4S dicluster domain-containing protein [Deltaproteobacteria bacterium]|nr:4Fe-4S dicluster domain-containing protein [Deltaproteobacteria bacterium]
MKINRRTFLKLAGATGAAGMMSRPRKARAAGLARLSDNSYAVLVDTTLCVGCRACEAACSEANRLPEPVMPGDQAVFEKERSTSPQSYTVVNRSRNTNEKETPRFVKSQCMHCVQPACASACPVRALVKSPEGPVVYQQDRCIGCRYCMVACPFGIPKFEYEKAVPSIRKCSFCAERQKQGKLPACAEVCPTGALKFGKREELLEIARTRIYQNPDRYIHHIYGEHEVGGTGWLYITDVPFEKLGFRMDLGTTSYPEFTWPFLSAVPFVLMLWPPFLMGIYAFTKNREKTTEAGEKKEARYE